MRDPEVVYVTMIFSRLWWGRVDDEPAHRSVAADLLDAVDGDVNAARAYLEVEAMRRHRAIAMPPARP